MTNLVNYREPTVMVAANTQQLALTEEVVAELAATAYRVALRHGTQGVFIDLELDLWRALRAKLSEAAADRALEVAVP
jgi:hypothetical protein